MNPIVEQDHRRFTSDNHPHSPCTYATDPKVVAACLPFFNEQSLYASHLSITATGEHFLKKIGFSRCWTGNSLANGRLKASSSIPDALGTRTRS
jgi:hypothetical protein